MRLSTVSGSALATVAAMLAPDHPAKDETLIFLTQEPSGIVLALRPQLERLAQQPDAVRSSMLPVLIARLQDERAADLLLELAAAQIAAGESSTALLELVALPRFGPSRVRTLVTAEPKAALAFVIVLPDEQTAEYAELLRELQRSTDRTVRRAAVLRLALSDRTAAESPQAIAAFGRMLKDDPDRELLRVLLTVPTPFPGVTRSEIERVAAQPTLKEDLRLTLRTALDYDQMRRASRNLRPGESQAN